MKNNKTFKNLNTKIMKYINSVFISLVLLLIFTVNGFTQYTADVKGVWIKNGPDSLILSLQVRNLGGSIYTLSSTTIWIRFPKMTSNPKYATWGTQQTRFSKITGTTVAKGYSALQYSRIMNGGDSIIQVSITGPNVNLNGLWYEEGDSGFTVTGEFREIGRVFWRVIDPVALVTMTIDGTPTFVPPGPLAFAGFNFLHNDDGTMEPFGGGTTVLLDANITKTNPPAEAPLPVQLASFTGNVENKRDIALSWKTEMEVNNQGFDIERKQTDGGWSKVGYIEGKGTVNTPVNYRFEDKKLNTGKYNYRLKQIDNNGNFEYFNLANAIEVGVPTKYDMSQNYPNPFNPTTKIDFDLPLDSRVSITLYDISGREIKTLVNEQKTAGYYTIQFNSAGLSSGTYFYRIMTKSSAADYIMTKKMVLIK